MDFFGAGDVYILKKMAEKFEKMNAMAVEKGSKTTMLRPFFFGRKSD